MREHYPRPLLYAMVSLLVMVAETFRWRQGLSLKPVVGFRFYAIIAAMMAFAVATMGWQYLSRS